MNNPFTSETLAANLSGDKPFHTIGAVVTSWILYFLTFLDLNTNWEHLNIYLEVILNVVRIAMLMLSGLISILTFWFMVLKPRVGKNNKTSK